jgi:hypothetical protein
MRLLFAFSLVAISVASCKTVNNNAENQVKSEEDGSFPFEEMTTGLLSTLAEFRALAGDAGLYTGYVFDHDSLFPLPGWTGEFFAFRKRNIFHADISWMGKSGTQERPTIGQANSAMQFFNSGALSGGAIFYFPTYSLPKPVTSSTEVQLPGTMFIVPSYLPTLSSFQEWLSSQPGSQPADEASLHSRIAEIIAKTCSKARQNIAFTKNVYYVYNLEYVPEAHQNVYKDLAHCIVSPSYYHLAQGENRQIMVYHEAHSFGYLRKLSASELADSDYNAKEIIVMDDVPLDISPTAGIISLKRQVPDSHIILRAINLNIIDASLPNDMAKKICDQWTIDGKGEVSCTLGLDQWKSLNGFYNQPVEVLTRKGTVADSNGDIIDLLFMRVTSVDEVEKQLAAKRPDLPDPQFEPPTSNFYTGNMDETGLRASLYGAKGRNFIALHRVLASAGYDRKKFDGTFLIPFYYYIEHVQQKLNQELCLEAETKCIEDYLESSAVCLPYDKDGAKSQSFENCALEKRAEAPFCSELALSCGTSLGSSIQGFIETGVAEHRQNIMSDSRIRRQFFKYAQRLIEEAPLSDELEAKISATILAAHPSTPPRFRFRSSTNAEDIEGLNGAGMYRSAAGCLDLDVAGTFSPKKCLTYRERARSEALRAGLQAIGEYPNLVYDITDNLQDKRSIPKAIKKVYASLWSEKAYMYRDYFGIDHKKVYMGLLAHSSFMDESANGVVVVRPKASGQLEISVTVQLDDISITNPEVPNSYPDQIVVTADRSGAIGNVNYVMRSNLANQDILSAEQLSSLISQVALIHGEWVKKTNNSGIKLDFEFKRGPSALPKGPADNYQIHEQIDIKQVRPL